jgi:hypothetical protein
VTGSRRKRSRQPGDAFRVGGGEQQGLPLHRALLGHLGDVVDEPHVQHAVRLVEHQGIERLELQVAAFQVVQHPARRADHDVRAVFQAGGLAPQRHAAGQRDHLDVVLGARQPPDFGGDLVGQLARGAQHQRLRREPARIQPGQQRQRERRGLAAAGLGLGDQVAPGQCRRQAGRLDGRHLVVAEAAEVLQRGGSKGKGIETGRLGHHPIIPHLSARRQRMR